MNPTRPSQQAQPRIEAGLVGIEQALASLSAALRRRDPGDIETQSERLHQALQTAVNDLNMAARRGELTPDLRERLGRTSQQIHQQQDLIHRASVSLDQLLVGLIPGGGETSTYAGTPYAGQNGQRANYIG